MHCTLMQEKKTQLLDVYRSLMLRANLHYVLVQEAITLQAWLTHCIVKVHCPAVHSSVRHGN